MCYTANVTLSFIIPSTFSNVRVPFNFRNNLQFWHSIIGIEICTWLSLESMILSIGKVHRTCLVFGGKRS